MIVRHVVGLCKREKLEVTILEENSINRYNFSLLRGDHFLMIMRPKAIGRFPLGTHIFKKKQYPRNYLQLTLIFLLTKGYIA